MGMGWTGHAAGLVCIVFIFDVIVLYIGVYVSKLCTTSEVHYYVIDYAM